MALFLWKFNSEVIIMLCQNCKKKPTCTKACKKLEEDLKSQEGYMREMLVSPKTLEWLAINIYHGEWHMRCPEYRENLRNILSKLPQTEQDMVEMRFTNGKPYREIGEVYGLSKKQMSRIMRDILLKIKDLIEKA